MATDRLPEQLLLPVELHHCRRGRQNVRHAPPLLLQWSPLIKNPSELSAKLLTGRIPTELALLSKLEIMYELTNHFSGTIPTQLGLVTSLTRINLNGNQMTGAIPTELGRLTNLEFIDFTFNPLTGSIPTELGQLTNLDALRLAATKLTGNLPTKLGRLTKLEIMDLDVSGFSGTIPTEIGMLTSLTRVNLYGNQIAGSIPSELGRLKALTFLDLRGNNLTGSIPCEQGSLKQLTTAEFSGNALTSSTFNIAEFDATCKNRPVTSLAPSGASANPPPSTFSAPSASFNSPSLIPSPSANSGSPNGQQSNNAPVIGGVAGAAVVLAIIVAVCLWSRRKGAKKETSLEPSIERGQQQRSNSTAASNSTAPATPLPVMELEADAPQVTESSRYLVASKSRAWPEDRKTGLFDPISNPPAVNARHNQKTETEVQLKASIPEESSKQSASDFASGRDDSTSACIPLPNDARDWNQDETAQWIMQRFGNPRLTASVLRQKINGRALLMLERQDIVGGLGLEAIGERLLFEEALAELRIQSNWQSVAVDENPPSYQ
ncbi:hypothetical protein HDU81_001866 [Chytriomyces hyalinus]|nr:hypothetical protein HDU81_001866 [Chytriomyces hyalinus]